MSQSASPAMGKGPQAEPHTPWTLTSSAGRQSVLVLGFAIQCRHGDGPNHAILST